MATIGLDKLYYATITEATTASTGVEIGDETFGTPAVLAKAISASISVETDNAVLYADDGADVRRNEFKSGSITLDANNLTGAAIAALTGAVVDSKGVLIGKGESNPKPVAIGFRAKTAAGNYQYFWLYRVTFGFPSDDLQTQGETVQFSTPKLVGTFTRRNKKDTQNEHPFRASVDAGETGVDATVIASWFNSVYEPTYQ